MPTRAEDAWARGSADRVNPPSSPWRRMAKHGWPLAAAALGAALAAAWTAARPGPAAAPHGEVHGALGAQLDRYMSRLEAFGFSGSLLVARHGQVAIHKGYGRAE